MSTHIKKLEIVNVGRFKSAKTGGDPEFFKANTFIFGRNTFGKSTVTAILRSLKENNPDFIVGRKTVGGTNQLAKISDVDGAEYRYTTEANAWTAQMPEICIFDSHFVRENVYAHSQQISQDQQKKIEAFLLGQKGIEFNKKIEELEEKIRLHTRTQTSINGEYRTNKHLLGGLEFEAFLQLPELPDVDTKLEETQRELDKTKNAELISSKLNSIKSRLEALRDFDVSGLQSNLTVNSEVIAKHFDEHLSKTETKQTYSTFLQTGAKLRSRSEGEVCPFCTQRIADDSAKEFLETIDSIYNENYRVLQLKLKEAEAAFLQSAFSSEIEKTKEDLVHAGASVSIDCSDIENFLNECSVAIAAKKEDLSKDIDVAPFESLKSAASAHLVVLDEELGKFADPRTKNAELETQLKTLSAHKERHGSWKQKCNDYIHAKSENKALGDQKTAIWEEYLVYAGGLSTVMLGDINSVLEAFECDFRIEQFQFRGNQRQDLLALKIENEAILNDGPDSGRTIKNCLSESDKWILALAFFLVAVKHDDSVKVVVMDDPVSSFDSERKRTILKQIKSVFDGSDKQLIVLTHEKGFYQLLHAEYTGDTSAVFLKLSCSAGAGSDFVECDPEMEIEFMSDYNRWIAEMRLALESHDEQIVRSAHGNIRKVIERVLRTKYPLELTKEHNTIDRMLIRLEEAGAPYSALSPREAVNTLLTNVAHHDHSANGQYPIEEVGINDYKNDIREVFVIMRKL